MDGVVGMVLAAGLGTRLRPLTDVLPKPAVPVAGVPAIQLALARLRAAGARRAVVNTHHLADGMAAVATAAARSVAIDLSVSHEIEIAGTGGALREARPLLGSATEIVLWNGDILFDVDLGPVLDAHRRSGALATMVLAPMPPGAAYATVDVDHTMAVRRIAGLGPGGDALEPLHFTGVHVLSPAILDHVPARPHACDVNRRVHVPLLAAGLVRAVVATGYWNDLGTPERYLAANLDVLAGRARFSGAGGDPFAGLVARAERVWVAGNAEVDPSARLAGPALVGPGAVVEAGASVGPGVVVGAGSRVGRGAALERAVVWPGTEIAAGERLSGAVAAGALRVPAVAPERH
ncbi:MAG TPA: sugar phosphate nucleotidyltransferase [Anaeromyxobacteraceae bacterium]|nr:sugar phosphate nucleotidyltransferase [Anaeromyxobacteraceae bacterium]